MKLVSRDDPVLRTPTEEFDFANPPEDPAELAIQMVEFMRKSGGIGLAANQIGKSYRVFAMETDPARVCFNPRIVSVSEESILLEEGCLSYPGLFVKIKRPRHCRLRFLGPNGETFTEQFTGMTARIVQHEIDHLDGILFFEKANRFHREQAFKNWKKWESFQKRLVKNGNP